MKFLRNASASVVMAWVGIIGVLVAVVMATTGVLDKQYLHTQPDTRFSNHALALHPYSIRNERAAQTPKRFSRDTLPELLDAGINIVNIQNEHELQLSEYKIYQSYNLGAINNALKGKLLLIIDKRLTGMKATVKHDNLYSITEYSFLSDEKANGADADTGYKNAALMMIDEHLKIIWQNILDQPCARLDTCAPYGNSNPPSFLLTVDYTAGFGSYNGPVSYFVEPTERIIAYIVDKNGFVTSLKSQWAMCNNNHIPKILYKYCRPDFGHTSGKVEDPKFNTFYIEYVYESGEWISTTRREDGIWENEESDNDTDALKTFVEQFHQRQ